MNQDFSIITLVLHAGFVVQLVIAGLLLTSLASWSVIFNKLFGLLNNPHFIMPTLIVSSLHGALTLTIVTTEPACSPELGPAFLRTLKGHLARMATP